MRVLVINTGSSSLKASLADVSGREVAVRARHEVQRIGAAGGEANDHAEAFELALAALGQPDVPDAVGHRVVHGGRYTAPVVISGDVIASIEGARRLAPLHNEPALAAIAAARRRFPATPMVAAFDTAFHAGMPAAAGRYAIPIELAEKYDIRRFGYHGLAHRAMAERYAEMTGTAIGQARIITFQLGNGCSVTAVRGGRSVDTSMGFTPLEGLMMGTRSGDIDAAVVTYLQREAGLSAADVDTLLNAESGLLGVSGRTRDMRDLLALAGEGDERAALAIEMFCYRAAKYAGAYFAALGGADALVFGGGIGERAPEVRRRICAPLAALGLAIDGAANARVSGTEGAFHAASSRVGAYVIPSDEERVIARDVTATLTGGAHEP